MRHLLRSLGLLLILPALLAPALAAEEAEVIEYQEGDWFPPYQGLTIDEEPFDLADHYNQGKFILIDFWASWCGPCMADMPNMIRAQNESQNARFEILTVSFDEEATRQRLADAIAEHGITFPIVTEWKRWESSWVDGYGINSIPANFLLAPDGTVLMRNLHGEDLVEITKQFAAMPPEAVYEPIRLQLEIKNMPERPTAEAPERTIEALDVRLQVHNPQLAKREALRAGVKVVSYVGTGTKTLKMKPDGTPVVHRDSGEPVIFEVATVDEQTFETQVEGEVNTYTNAGFILPIPAGAMDAELFPWTWSPALGREILGAAEYPSWSARYWITEDELEVQGGVIDPETYVAPEPEAAPAEAAQPAA